MSSVLSEQAAGHVEEFAIIFDSDPPVYREGDNVSGTILIHNTEDVRYGAVLIELCGIALVQWSTPLPDDEAHGDIIDPDDIRQGDYNKEEYFKKKIILLEKELETTKLIYGGDSSVRGDGGGRGCEVRADSTYTIPEHKACKNCWHSKDGGFLERDPVLEKGHHMYRFEIKLPIELPSSFEGQYGQIRYVARAVIERNWKSNVVTKRAFTVISGLDLNFIPEAAAKIELCKYKSLGNCCTAGSVTADWTVERSGFVPGEDIMLHGAVQNECKENVTLSRVALYMVIEYKARKRRRREKREVAVIEKGMTTPDETTVWNDVLHIPPLPPTGLSRCRLLDIKYELKFSAVIEGGYTPVEFTKEIYIGTVPMCRSEMKSCIAGLYNQPYTRSVDNLTAQDVFAGTRASQMSLTQIVSVGCARQASNPSAPNMSVTDLDTIAVDMDPSVERNRFVGNNTSSDEIKENIVISGIGLSPTKPKNEDIVFKVNENVMKVSSISECTDEDRPPPFAPGHMNEQEARPAPTNPSAPPLALYPSYEAGMFGPVSLRDTADDEQSLRGEFTYNPMYTYYETIGKAPE